LDGSILPGITRKTVLELLRKLPVDSNGKKMLHKVTERQITVDELEALLHEGRILEIFGTGTAVVVVPLKMIGIKNDFFKLKIPKGQGCGPICGHIYKSILDIQYGRVKSDYQYEAFKM
jgi:branched-chain amino acid aminotransferase